MKIKLYQSGIKIAEFDHSVYYVNEHYMENRLVILPLDFSDESTPLAYIGNDTLIVIE